MNTMPDQPRTGSKTRVPSNDSTTFETTGFSEQSPILRSKSFESSVRPRSPLNTLLFSRIGFRLLVLATASVSTVFGIAAPYAQKQFTDGLIAGNTTLTWMFAAFGFTAAALVLTQLTTWVATRESVIAQVDLSDHALDRALEGPGGLVGNRPVGESVSLFAVDVPGCGALLDQSLIMCGSIIFPFIAGPIALHTLFQIPWFASLAAIATLALINITLGYRQSRYFYRYKELSAERTGLVSEWVQNLRTLRILGWIESAEEKLFEVRERETRHRMIMLVNGQLMNSVANVSTYILTLLSVVMLLEARGPDHPPTAGDLLGLYWIIGVFLSRPLRQFPWAIVITMDAWTSMQRLKAALDRPISHPEVLHSPASREVRGSELALEVEGLHLEIEGKRLLESINLRMKTGELVAIVGEVGSGKSLLLRSLTGSTGATFQRFALQGKPSIGPKDPEVRNLMAFVSQEGFTMSATLRENVRFEYLNPETVYSAEETLRTERALKLAQFVPTQERLPDGIETEIGERGVNLSGGQRQRIGLARAEFANRPIIVLDDCLSAVDVDTEKRLIESLISGEWSNRTRIIATHRMTILPQCDRILFLSDGQVKAEGRFDELYENEESFRKFVKREELPKESQHRLAASPPPPVVSLVEGIPKNEESTDG